MDGKDGKEDKENWKNTVKRFILCINGALEEKGIKNGTMQYLKNNAPKFSKTEARHPDIDSRSAMNPNQVKHEENHTKAHYIKKQIKQTNKKTFWKLNTQRKSQKQYHKWQAGQEEMAFNVLRTTSLHQALIIEEKCCNL